MLYFKSVNFMFLLYENGHGGVRNSPTNCMQHVQRYFKLKVYVLT